MDEILIQLKQLKKLDALDGIQKELVIMRKAMEDLGVMKEEINLLKKENESQRKRIAELEENQDYMENQSKRENLLFGGIKEREDETWEDCVQEVIKLGEKIGVTLSRQDIIRAHRLPGKKSPRMIVAKFQSWPKREELLKNKSKLKDTDLWIMEHFSRKVIAQRRVLFEEAKLMERNGEEAYVRFNRLHTANGIYRWDLEEQMMVLVYKKDQSNKKGKRKRGDLSAGGSPEQNTKLRAETDGPFRSQE